jgi:hypothetical protein
LAAVAVFLAGGFLVGAFRVVAFLRGVVFVMLNPNYLREPRAGAPDRGPTGTRRLTMPVSDDLPANTPERSLRGSQSSLMDCAPCRRRAPTYGGGRGSAQPISLLSHIYHKIGAIPRGRPQHFASIG